ncbi:trimeric intracellular cation channel family protein [Paenibacillus sp. YN15]|uniref:trimeric intracellular cation channel family protein n=1 Tax=Paenibacillus sp. YN15 TaxID=1742774 RepID=UPI000DCF2316|nr:trimeric intracellular cation channel family protein [Paenibacillus sp. YN15]RAV06505.1 trimeric intracellular cation channel family protein [Paenibacillus sp. YN15]
MQLIEVFIYLGIVAAGISGAVIGIQKEMDLFGVTSLCVATSLGGGIVRDLLIGVIPPVAFVEPKYFVSSLAAGLLTWVFYPYISRFNNLLMVSDAVGLGVFTAVGAKAALGLGYDEPFIILSMGLITGIGGGVVRDLFSREIPYVFRKEVYAVASILGAGSLVLVHDFIPVTFAMYICLLVTFLVRVLCVMYSVNFPVYRIPQARDTKKHQG